MPTVPEGRGRGLVVAGGQQQQVAGLVMVQSVDGVLGQVGFDVGTRLPGMENPIDQSGDAQHEDRVHVVPQLPFLQHTVGPAALAAAQLVAEAVQEWIEVVVLDHEQPPVGVLAIVLA
ncbi:MAG: hypothetical protein MUE50_27640 [Pirellulaceae bacterium]|nr:hypothetical protein [Pirellulaceae bacterium]